MQSNSRLKETYANNFSTEDAWISDLDPILQGGFKISYLQPQFVVEIRRKDAQNRDQSFKQLMNLRILTIYAEKNLSEMKIELSSQQDLFKLYICWLDIKKFDSIKKAQHLNFSFDQLLPMLIKQISLSQKSLDEYSSVLYLSSDNSPHHLDLLQNIKFKRIELLSLVFDDVDDESIKNYAIFRFTKIKMNKQIINKKLKDVISMVKIKNQNLLTDIFKKEKKDSTLRYSK